MESSKNSQNLPTRQRVTKYCTAVEAILAECGHATNAELVTRIRLIYPAVSATTIHRATARLAEYGRISHAPPDAHGAMRYDGNVTQHDHFMCAVCGILRDANLLHVVRPAMEQQVAGCSISGPITVSGTCKRCAKKY